jgi:precorrin-6A synthase
MIELALVGIGSGHPDHLTPAARAALEGAEIVLLPLKGDEKSDLADVRRSLAAGLRGPRLVAFDMPERAADGAPYLDRVGDWHAAIAQAWAGAIGAHLPGGRGRVALMVWGDPSLYDSTLRIAERLPALGLPVRVRMVPGLTSLQLLTAAHGIALNTLGGAVQITTGRRLRDHGWPEGAATLAVMLDAGGAFGAISPQGVHIWWGAYLGMAAETLIAGPLSEVAPKILATRADLRAHHGWIMDTYLMRRGG